MRTKSLIPGCLALLFIAAACTSAPPPAPGADTPPAAPSDTPLSQGESDPGYPAATDPPYPALEETTPETGYPPPDEAGLPDPGYPAPGAGDVPGDGYPAPGEGGCDLDPPTPQRHELTASDGIALVGTFYPAANCSSPLVVLYHQFGSNKESWTDLALWLQNRIDETASSTGGRLAAPAFQYAWFPPLPGDLSFAVFTVDFRDHGESEPVGGGLDTSGFLLDAQAAFDYAKNLPNVDPSRVITLGASIGADASVDVCLTLDGTAIADDQSDEGCIGAMPLSPGSFLEVPYAAAAARLGEAPFDVNIHCVAAEQDGNSPDLCLSEVPGRHLATVYAGRDEHGIALLAEGFDPDIGAVIHSFLLEILGFDG